MEVTDMNSADSQDAESDFRAQAAEWVERIARSDGDQHFGAAEAWCAQSSLHRREFLLAAITDAQFVQLRKHPFSLGIKGYRQPLHDWLLNHLNRPDLERLAADVYTHFSQAHLAKSAESVTDSLYRLAGTLASQASADEDSTSELGATLEQAVRGLPSALRDALLLCSRDRLTPEEAAEVLGISAAEIGKRLVHARSVIALKLREHG